MVPEPDDILNMSNVIYQIAKAPSDTFLFIEVSSPYLLSGFLVILLVGLGEECGFNSRSSFYRVFKEYTGLTPAEYQEKLNQSH